MATTTPPATPGECHAVQDAVATRASTAFATPAGHQPTSCAPGLGACAAHERDELEEGDLVKLQNLQARPELNGHSAAVLEYHTDRQRWAIEMLETRERLLLKRASLVVVGKWRDLICASAYGNEEEEDEEEEEEED